MNESNHINSDKIFWEEYLDFPYEKLIENIDRLLQDEEEQEESKLEMQVDHSIENYLDTDLFPSQNTNTNTEKKHSASIPPPPMPQFAFTIDQIPPFHFLFPPPKNHIIQPPESK